MKKSLVLLIVALLGISSLQAVETGYEKRAFAGRFSLWQNVRCVADSVRVIADSDQLPLTVFSLTELEAEARSGLARLVFPKLCDPSVAPAPATMASVAVEVLTVLGDQGDLVYFVRLRARMPDGDFKRTDFGQFTTWESSGRLGHAYHERIGDSLRVALAEQVEEFAAFMRKARALGDG